MVYKKIEATISRDVVLLPGSKYRWDVSNLSQKEKNTYITQADSKADLVVLPTKNGIEHYLEEENKIASYGYFSRFIYDNESQKGSVEFYCSERCIVENITIDGSHITTDIKLIKDTSIDDYKEKLSEIYEKFKDYLKYVDIDLEKIDLIRNPKSIDSYIFNITNECKFDTEILRKLLEETDNLKRLDLINTELGAKVFEQSSERGKDIISYYKNKVNELEISDETKKILYNEISRLRDIKPGNSEYGNITDWLNRVLQLPWNKRKEENQDIEYAKKMLNSTHYGMDKLKQKILDYIAIRMLSGKNSNQIMCLYGPPGVGKSTIVQSIAKALDKDFYAFSLGGVNVPEDIHGMSRSFVGAKPGRIIDSVMKAGSKNCLILLDEIDKVGRSDKGNPYSVLLEVLDKNQNSQFKDKYLEIPFDLSEVMFIATANRLDTIPEPLLNRMEIITIEGYSINEKIHIAQEFILKKVLRNLGQKEDLISISKETLRTIIEDYTFEGGVRQLERAIESICQQYLISLFMNNKQFRKTTISTAKAIEILGKNYYNESVNVAKEGEIGVINKMSVAGHSSGTVSRLEISLVKGNGEQILSDNLVGTAKWTFKTVFGLLKSKAKDWKIDLKVFDQNNFYIHSPHHGISHDGPSGGVADILCLVSAIKEIPINHKYAFTGEITLKGKVLAIGGIKQKLLAAQRNKIETVVVPLDNKREIEDLSEEIVGDMKIVYVDNIDDAYNFVFSNNNNKRR